MTRDYFFYLYLLYVGLQCLLTLTALCWWPSPEELELVHEGYLRLSSGPLADGTGEPLSSPEVKAGLLSRLTFAWLSPLMGAGYSGKLGRDQIPELPPQDSVDSVMNTFKR